LMPIAPTNCRFFLVPVPGSSAMCVSNELPTEKFQISGSSTVSTTHSWNSQFLDDLKKWIDDP
jgi:hypothetical protein